MKLILSTIAMMSLMLVSFGAAPAATGQQAADIDGISAAIALIPSGVLPAKSANWTVAKHDVSNDVFTHQVKGKTIRLQLKVQSVARGEGGGYIVKCIGSGRDVTPFNLYTDLQFPPSECIAAARVNVGDDIFAQGMVSASLFDVQATGTSDFTCQLNLSLGHVIVESKTAEIRK